MTDIDLPDPARWGFDVRGNQFATIPVPEIPAHWLILIHPLHGREPVRAKVDDKPDWKRQEGLPVMEWRDGEGYTHPNVYYACYAIDVLRMCGECEMWGTTDDDYLCEECRQAYVH